MFLQVCRAYDYLCRSIKIPSAFFTHITCSVIKFFNEMGNTGIFSPQFCAVLNPLPTGEYGVHLASVPGSMCKGLGLPPGYMPFCC